MKYAIATIVILFASLAGAQEIKHAPTIDQCRADQKLWLSYVEDESTVVSYEEFDNWEPSFCHSSGVGE
jgi:hypothetical protein